jgi:hypothetical protein
VPVSGVVADLSMMMMIIAVLLATWALPMSVRNHPDHTSIECRGCNPLLWKMRFVARMAYNRPDLPDEHDPTGWIGWWMTATAIPPCNNEEDSFHRTFPFYGSCKSGMNIGICSAVRLA